MFGLVCLVLPILFRDGMFMDGIIYSSISHNLANGYGSFFSPLYTETVDTYFNSHPPLVFWVQSLFFNVFGDGFWVERLYMFIILVLNLIGLYKILNVVGRKDLFIYACPLLLFTPLLLWGYQNNILECTMMLFALWSIYVALLIVKEKVNSSLGLMIMALLITMSFLSKGVPGLFPLGAFALLSLSLSNYSFKKAIIHTTILTGMISLLGFIALLHEGTYSFFEGYFNKQVIRSLNGDLEEVFPSRLKVLFNFTLELGILWGISLLSIVWKKFNKNPLFSNESNKQVALFFFFVGVSASIPLLLSPKLRTFYFIPAIPYFILGTVLLIPPLNLKQRFLTLIKYFGVALSIIGVTLAIAFWSEPKRDNEVLSDIHKIAAITSDKTILFCDSPIAFNHTVRAYFMRYHFISLTLESDLPKRNKKLKYYVRRENIPTHGYLPIDINTKHLFLFELDSSK